MADHKKDADELLPWENEKGRKRKPERGDSIPPSTSIKSRVHSKPGASGQEYLDMYIMTKEKERAESYGTTLGKQLKNISSAWRKIKEALLQKEQASSKGPEAGTEESHGQANTNPEGEKKIPGHMKKMDWDY